MAIEIKKLTHGSFFSLEAYQKSFKPGDITIVSSGRQSGKSFMGLHYYSRHLRFLEKGYQVETITPENKMRHPRGRYQIYHGGMVERDEVDNFTASGYKGWDSEMIVFSLREDAILWKMSK